MPLACGRNDVATLFETGRRNNGTRRHYAALDHAGAYSAEAGATGGAGGMPPATPVGASADPYTPEPEPTHTNTGAGGRTAWLVVLKPLRGGLGTKIADAGTADADGSAGALGDAASCISGTWYADGDGDLYGRSSANIVGCKPASAPAGGGAWVALGGDCNDDDADVHPGQTSFFGTPYMASNGELSFDYDCSGAEDGDPSQSVDPLCCTRSPTSPIPHEQRLHDDRIDSPSSRTLSAAASRKSLCGPGRAKLRVDGHQRRRSPLRLSITPAHVHGAYRQHEALRPHPRLARRREASGFETVRGTG